MAQNGEEDPPINTNYNLVINVSREFFEKPTNGPPITVIPENIHDLIAITPVPMPAINIGAVDMDILTPSISPQTKTSIELDRLLKTIILGVEINDVMLGKYFLPIASMLGVKGFNRDGWHLTNSGTFWFNNTIPNEALPPRVVECLTMLYDILSTITVNNVPRQGWYGVITDAVSTNFPDIVTGAITAAAPIRYNGRDLYPSVYDFITWIQDKNMWTYLVFGGYSDEIYSQTLIKIMMLLHGNKSMSLRDLTPNGINSIAYPLAYRLFPPIDSTMDVNGYRYSPLGMSDRLLRQTAAAFSAFTKA